MSITSTLKKALRTNALSVYAICKKTGVDKGAVSRFLSGKTGMQTDSVDKLCAFLKLELVPKTKRRGRKI